MRKAAPWTIAVIASLAFVVTFHELQRVRGKFGELSKNVNWQRMAIDASLTKASGAIVFFGDSVTADAKLPAAICGHLVINAGLRGARTFQLIDLVHAVMKDHPPFISVVAAGLNDARDHSKTFGADYRALLEAVDGPLVVASITQASGVEVTSFNKTISELPHEKYIRVVDQSGILPGEDGIHPDAEGSKRWVLNLVGAIEEQCSIYLPRASIQP